MRKFARFVLLPLLVLLIIFIAYTLVSTGFFRSVDNKFSGTILKSIPIYGAEDITISAAGQFALISATHRNKLPSESVEKGGLYFLDLRDERFIPLALTSNQPSVFAPHGISLFQKDSSYQVLVVNHTFPGHSIEVFELKDSSLSYQRTITHPTLVSPNDVVQISENEFYFTNDHGYTTGVPRFIEEYGGMNWSNVIYYDGTDFREVANEISYANGINYDPMRKLLFVASPRKMLVKVYQRQIDGSLNFVEDIPCGMGVDNIEFDEQGRLWIGGHPDLIGFATYAKGDKAIAPSEIIAIDYRGTNDYSIEQIFTDDGTTMSGASVAAPYKDVILAGNVMDKAFLVLRRAQ